MNENDIEEEYDHSPQNERDSMEIYNERGCFEILAQFIEEPEFLIESCES
jgi:hypothetical protein